ncbi:twin-arginine translocase TatA/TatE family subunit [Leucobacter sp. VD1]|uniref:twin-arginine translocase TatA/TatE family subunit n=1 Tax=Leucobacter sp. VD1 TaxID=3080381 RepID=UPI00301721E8
MFGNLSGPTLVVILFIVLLLFGAPKLPGLAKSLGQSMRILKKEVRNDDAAEKGSDGAPESPSSESGHSNTARPEPREGGNTAPGDKP